MKRPRVLLADDHSIVLAGIRGLLGDTCEVVGEMKDGASLVAAALRLRPELIILDISMPILNGLDAARQIKKQWPDARLLFLSMHQGPVYLREALSAGGGGYLLKSSAPEELRSAISKVLKGQLYLDPGFDRRILEKTLTPSGRPPRSSIQLTDRQRQIVQLIAEGRVNKEIAGILKVSVKTVEFHRGRIMAKLGVHTAAALSAYAVRQGLAGE